MTTLEASPIDTSSVNKLPLSFQTLIQFLHQTPHCDSERIYEYIDRANVAIADLMPWADFSHPITDSYGRKLVYHGGYFEIMVMSWAPGDYSAIHDHGKTQWGAVQCFGAAEHYIYAYNGGVLTTLQPAHYAPRMIHTVDNGLIHQMGNPGDSPFLSLHVYGCTDHRNTITGNARIFDLLEGTIQYTDGGVFFCLPDYLIKQRYQGLQGDVPTTLKHHQYMGDRINRILAVQDSPELRLKLTRLSHDVARLTHALCSPYSSSIQQPTW